MTEGIYISYPHEHRLIALFLSRELERAGITTWIDDKVLRAGQPWAETLINAVNRSSALLLLISEEAVNKNFIKVELSNARRLGKPIVPVMLSRNMRLLEEFELQDVHSRVLFSSDDVDTIVRDVRELLIDRGLPEVVDRLHSQDFSQNFITMFTNLAVRQQTETLTLHFQSDLSLENALSIERAMNNIAWELLSGREDMDSLVIRKHREPILAVRSHTHPGSTELIMALSQAAAITFVSSPDVRAFIVGFITNALYDVSKSLTKTIGARIFGADKQEKWIHEQSGPQITVSRTLEENVVKVMSNQVFVGISDGKLVFGIEKVERTNSKLIEADYTR